MWNEQFRVQPTIVEIDGEMRTAFADWVAEHYGIHPGSVVFDKITRDSAKFTLPIGECDSAGYGASVEMHLHPNGGIESTLVIYGPVRDSGSETRIPLPNGELPPDKETFASNLSFETCDTWKRRLLGWHPAYAKMLDCLAQMAQTAMIDDGDVITVAGFYPDGEQLPDFATQYPMTVKGIQAALTHARAMLKGGQAYYQHTPLEYDEGNFMLVLFPGKTPLETGEWLTTAGPDYSTWVADMPVTNKGNNDSKDTEWANVMPLLDD